MSPTANQNQPAQSGPNLASCYQEILTVVARLRSKKVALGDSAVFRTQVRQALQHAEGSAQAAGYSQDDTRQTSFAVVALLDETILNSSNPNFRDWAHKPLMLDLYNTLNAGETCFEYIGAALNRQETKSTIDLLEIYFLCLALGFRGRYGYSSGDPVRAWRDPLVEKILRVRGGGDPVVLSRTWRPELDIEAPEASNRFTSIALSCCIGVFAGCALLGGLYYWLLSRGVTELATFMPR